MAEQTQDDASKRKNKITESVLWKAVDLIVLRGGRHIDVSKVIAVTTYTIVVKEDQHVIMIPKHAVDWVTLRLGSAPPPTATEDSGILGV